jgi:hypothetical protein
VPLPPKRGRRGRGAQYEGNFLSGKPRPVGGELHFAYISRKSPSDTRLFFPEKQRNIYTATLWIPDWNISIL